MEITRVQELLEAFPSKRILVIGDVMLDEFIWGKVSRISPEAPVPVVEVTGESFYPGGAANVARNLKEFCEEAFVMGIIGQDRHGDQLREIMIELGLDLRCLFDDPAYKTIVKTRVVARQQQMVRVDREELRSPTGELLEVALRGLKKILPVIDAVIFEDYAKGLLSQEFVTRATSLIVAAKKIVTADPNPKNPLQWRGLTAIKPNRSEAFRCAGVIESDPDDDFKPGSVLEGVSQQLLEKWQAEHLLITLGEHGMVLYERGAPSYHIPTRAQEVYDVSGAGDTAIALFTLALAAGATPREAAEISNHASSVVVGKLGTATLTPAELLASFERHGPSVLSETQEVLAPVENPPTSEIPASSEPELEPTPEPEKVPEPVAAVAEVAVDPVPVIFSHRGPRLGFKRGLAKPKTGQTYPPTLIKRPDFEIAKPAVFLDRDGTLMEEVDYCSNPEDVYVFTSVPGNLYRLQQAGYLTIVITNQAGIGRGLFTEADYWKVHDEFLDQIGPRLLDWTYFCPDSPENASQRRKPGIGMIEDAVQDWNIDLSRSWFIGDKASDIECGKAAGVRTILVTTGYGSSQECSPDYRARDLASAVDWIVIE